MKKIDEMRKLREAAQREKDMQEARRIAQQQEINERREKFS